MCENDAIENYMQQGSIDDLIAVNARREPVGLVDLQDLPRLKLV